MGYRLTLKTYSVVVEQAIKKVGGRGGGWRVHVTAAGVAFGENERVSEIDRESQGCGA
jgi:hypothetical protein